MIDVDRFSKAYGDYVAVRDLSFQLQSGEILGLVGPNGAGKTTTLRAITGIIPASGGSVRVNGCDLSSAPLAVKRNTAYVPDDPQLFHDLTVEQHLEFTASAYDVENSDEKISDLLDRFCLTAKRHSPATDLSRGMRQKLAICCAYLYAPGALLLDEPMTGLDPPGIRMLKTSIVAEAQRGAAVVISSHLLAMVEDICTHVLILNEGDAAFFGTVEDLHHTFADDQESRSLEDIFFRAIQSASSRELVR